MSGLASQTVRIKYLQALGVRLLVSDATLRQLVFAPGVNFTEYMFPHR